MKRWKKYTSLLMALVLCLCLTACGTSNDDLDTPVVENDWRETDAVCDSGIITRDGEDTVVLVCVYASDTIFYYDTEEQVLFDSVDYPTTLESDAKEAFQSIDFADLNGDGNSDVTMKFNDGGSELLMVWFWDTESNQFVYLPDEPQLDDSNAVPVLMSGVRPFTNMETLQSENHEDGTYYYADMAEDGQILLVNTVLPRDFVEDGRTSEEYLTDCALDLGKAYTDNLLTVEQNDAYTRKMTYPVYIVTYTTGENEDSREWTVFAMDTDLYTYLYGFCASLDAADDVKSAYQDIFDSLYMSERE